jgi:hypothetical protein
MKAPDPTEGAVQAYERANARLELVLIKWEEAGRPLTYQQPNHVLCPHPLWTILREAERDQAKAQQAVRTKHRGRPPKAVITPSIGESPAAPLRSLERQ